MKHIIRFFYVACILLTGCANVAGEKAITRTVSQPTVIRCVKDGQTILFAQNVHSYTYSHGIATIEIELDGHLVTWSVYASACYFGLDEEPNK